MRRSFSLAFAGVLLGCSSTAALAQSATAAETPEAQGGDIIVTAQKREQKLQDVPTP